MKLKKINLTNIVGIKELIKYKKLKNLNNKNDMALKINKDYLKEKFKFESNKSNNNNVNEDSKNDIKLFNKTYNNKPFLSRKNIKEVSFKLNDVSKIIEEPDDESQIQKLMRNFSSNSKDSTMYKTKKKFFSSSQLKNPLSSDEKNRNFIRLNSNRKNSFFGRKMIRSYSANNIINKNNIGPGQSAFITALNPLINHRNVMKKISDNSNKSYFYNKIKSEKKFLTFYDIKKIYFLDKKVYKPNKEFEKEVNKLKRNNSNEFITNFNFDIYKMTILNLFQNQVSYHNFDVMKKNFDVINKGWKWKDNLKCHVRNRKRISTSQTEREMIYSQNKIDRDNRIKMRSDNLLKNQK
jgi:hypothetical protein